MAPGIGGMNPVGGMGMDPTAAASLGMTAGLGLGASDATMTMGFGTATVPAAAAAPPIATECLLVSNLFDPNKLASLSLAVNFFSNSAFQQPPRHTQPGCG